MSNKEMKKAIKTGIKEVMMEMERENKVPLSNEGRRIVEEDRFREEAYGKICEWIEEAFNAEMQKKTAEMSKELKVLKALIKKEQKAYNKYQVDIKLLKDFEKKSEKRFSKLERQHGKMEQILTGIAACYGLVSPGASFRDAYKEYKKATKKILNSRKSDRKYLLESNSIIDM